MRKLFCCGVALSLAFAFSSRAASPVHYELKKKFPIAGDGGWDYLTYDAEGKRLFISRATRVQVVNPEKGTVIAEIPNTPGVHGIALAQDQGKGFTSNGRENTVTVFDLKTLKETARIKLEGAEGPDAIIYDDASKRVLTFNGRSKNTSLIDATNNTVATTVALDGKPEFATSDGTGMVYVNIEDKNEIQAIDAKQGKLVSTWPLTGCDEPSGMAIDRKNHRLFSGCGNKVMTITNFDTGKVVTTVPIGPGVDANTFDPKLDLAFSSNGGDGTLTVVHEDSPDKFSVVENATTQRAARTMALNPDNHEVYLVTAEIEELPPAEGQTRPRRQMKPGSFTLLVMSKK
ncbi:MAG TPA: YncE family protein [Candidatus Angelobacter sp.]